MKTKTIEKTIFLADDGTEFLDKEKCKAYEDDYKNVKIFRVFHSPDLTEGRGLRKELLLCVKATFSHTLWAELWCERMFGSRVDFAQGVAIVNAWTLSESGWSWKDVLEDQKRSARQKDARKVICIVSGDTTHPSWKNGEPMNKPPAESSFKKPAPIDTQIAKGYQE
jgi:hypothetical protein